MTDFNDIEEMTKRFKNNPLLKDLELNKLDDIDFKALIYGLYTCQCEIVGFSTKSFLRYFLTSGQSENTNLPLNIMNNLKYTKKDFIETLTRR